MKFIAPIHVINYTGAPGGVQTGFKKFYLKDGYFKLFDGTTISDVVLDRPLDNFTPLPGVITANDTVLSALEKLDYAISNINPQQSLQLVVNAGNAISNFGGTSTADIQSTNFVNNRTLYLNNDAFATIKIVDNLNAAHNLTIDLDTINIDGVSYNWSSIVSPPPTILSALPFSTDHLAATNNEYVIGDIVYYLGDVYRCIASNDSIIPTSTLYWTNIGTGFPIVQQPMNWNSATGNNQILNKPTIPTVGTWGALNYPTWTSGTPFVKMTAAGVFTLDTSIYLTGITSSDVTTALGYTPVTNARTLTINGVTYDLTADRSWTISSGSGTVTSVGLTLPSAFNVTPTTPITSSGTFAITGAGTTAQYVKGDGTLGTTVTKTSELINDGDNGSTHFISLQDLPSNLILYPTTAASDISGYSKLVTSITDPSYNTGATDVSTGAITGTSQFISALASPVNIIIGNPGVFNITTVGNIRRVSGSGDATFYFQAYKRTSGGTETLVATSDNTLPIGNGTYSEFFAIGLWNDGNFLSTDRIVLKFYANRIAGGSNPSYQFQFGGTTPVRTFVPIPLNVTPGSSFIRRHSFTNFDGSNSYSYNGYAVQGSSESANVWTITRLTINAFGSVTKGVATNVAWTDRVTVIYT